MHKKRNGSYYTPTYLSEFITRYVANQFDGQNQISILEPSVGDGSFVKAFNQTQFPRTIKKFSFTAIEKLLPEIRKAENIISKERKPLTKYSFTKIDFLKYQQNQDRKFSLIVGNPPYVKKSLLKKKQIEFCKQIHESANLSEKTVKNIWSAFLVRCSQMLTESGVLAFVLPAELLQVKFSEELRAYLVEQFQRTEVFTFDDLLFECKGQDTILFVGYKQHQQQGQYYTSIRDLSQLSTGNFTLVTNNALASSAIKWTHHLIPADDLNFLYNISSRLYTVNHYCNSKPGIVTAANSFFIVNQETEQRYGLTNYSQPIIQKGLFVNGSIIFAEDDYSKLRTAGKPTSILCFNDNDVDNLPPNVIDYLEVGKHLGLHNRFKCKKRKNWFVIPNISTVPDGFFFKRSHNYPKLLKNNANVLVTDSGYRIEMHKGYHINHLVYSFYNSLTLAFSELSGRYYGGGVLELTPLEFKNLPLPYRPIGAGDFGKFAKHFETKSSIADILTTNNYEILNNSLRLSIEEIERIHNIYAILISKRKRN